MSHLRLALLHDLKAGAWPLSRDAPHWRAEARLRRDEAYERYSPSMAQRIDVEKLYRQARRSMPETHGDAFAEPGSLTSVPRTASVRQDESARQPG
jgi:hypothetical protein